VGMEKPDDAGVYKLTNDLAIIQTVDFFTPIVDDPFTFGQIAAANALSDVYAMGGTPITAMNLVCFPIGTMDIEILRTILKGGLKKLHEAGVALVGGHSVEDSELKYGLSVTGIINPEKIITNNGAITKDLLILTKPLGTGIINTAIKGEIASADSITKVINYMVSLNKTASDAMQEVGVNACTDITGFGLLGHAIKMVQDSNIGILFDTSLIPFFPEAQEYAKMGMVPAGTYRNREFGKEFIETISDISPYILDILFDPQTSGGLLISVSKDKADKLLYKLRAEGIEDAVIIGEVVDEPKGKIILR